MDLDDVKEVIELMKENDICELELERDGTKIALRRGGSQGREMSTHLPSQVSAGVAPVAPTEAPLATNIHIIKSPMVGTFYRSPSPEAEAFASNGKMVGPEDTVCIIEAMKVMNEIKAEIRGKIVAILVENGEPIEYGQELFRVEKE